MRASSTVTSNSNSLFSAQRKDPAKIKEGDILLTKVVSDMMQNKVTKTRELLENAKWPATKDASGKPVVNIPYTLHASLNSGAIEAINQAFGDYGKLSCLKFEPRQSEPDFVTFIGGNNG